MGKKEEQAVKKCILPYHVLIVVVLVLCVFVGIVSAGNVNDETKNSLPSTMPKSQPEEPSSILTITILNETTASGEWFIHVPSELVSCIPIEKNRLEENIDSLEKGVEDLLLQEVENIKIIEGNETIILTFDLLGNYTNSFVTGKFRYTYELNEYAPCFLNVLKIVIPQNKTLISVNPGVNAREGNALIYYDFNWIYPLDIRFTEKTHSISVIMGEEWELPKPYLADSSELSEEKGLISSELNEKHKSRFAEPDLLVGTGGDILNHIPQINALQIAEGYKPRLYLDPSSDQCPDRVFYRVV
jgi:biopolymer transport protein ExbD